MATWVVGTWKALLAGTFFFSKAGVYRVEIEFSSALLSPTGGGGGGSCYLLVLVPLHKS